MLNKALFIGETEGKGRGVFTKTAIRAGKVIEHSPVIVMDAGDRKMLDKTLLQDYIFEWGEDKKQCAMALGYIPIYNHSYASNCEYFMEFEKDSMYIKTVREILPGEELTINYNGDWDDEKKIWFEVKEK